MISCTELIKPYLSIARKALYPHPLFLISRQDAEVESGQLL